MKNLLFLLSIFLLSSCGIYSFSGVNLGKAKTISFTYFDNDAPIVNPNLSTKFYDQMYDRFVSQTPLEYVQRDGDLNFTGKIIGYDVKPIDIKAGETAAYNRLTVTVRVKFTNFKNPKQNFDRTFSWYADFESSKNLSDVEDELTTEIVKKIVDDLFNSSVVNW
jgi:hypothetical protein